MSFSLVRAQSFGCTRLLSISEIYLNSYPEFIDAPVASLLFVCCVCGNTEEDNTNSFRRYKREISSSSSPLCVLSYEKRVKNNSRCNRTGEKEPLPIVSSAKVYKRFKYKSLKRLRNSYFRLHPCVPSQAQM